jgi:hypothetical protein
MTREAVRFFCVILSAAKDLARLRASLKNHNSFMQSFRRGGEEIPSDLLS